MATTSIGFKIDVSPPPELASQPPAVRQEYWREVLRLALAAKDLELASGLDRHGMPLHPIAASTRRNRRSAMGPADPNAPPLTPAYGLSRTRALLTGVALPDGVRLTWKADPRGKQSWGQVLAYHRRGSKRLPVRDVIGLAPSKTEMVKRQSWAFFYKTYVAPVPVKAPARRPTIAARVRAGAGSLFQSVFGRRKVVV